MKAYILIKVRSGEVKTVVNELRKLKDVVEANMTFGPYDAVVVMEASDIGLLGSLIASSIQSIPGVDQTLTCIAVDI
ncbi:MAG: Lrp/AsnC ligand binding domain-containing protein [Anaerolineales bacterium]